jgi:CRISPR-associated endoribonuclease Cas6
MPSTWSVSLVGACTSVDPHHVHAVVSGWFDDLPNTNHEANEKPWSLKRSAITEDGLSITVGLLDNSSSSLHRERLLDLEGSEIRLGHNVFVVEDSPEMLESVEWFELLDVSSPTSFFAFDLQTPTVFRSGNESTALTPGLVFGHLRRRWSTFAPADLKPALDFSGCHFRTLESGYPVTAQTGPRSRPIYLDGSIGRIAMAVDANERDLRVLDTLARLCDFSGIGSYTTRGFGAAQYGA